MSKVDRSSVAAGPNGANDDLIKVLVADAQPLLAESLALALLRYPDIITADTGSPDAADAVRVALEHRPDVVLIDYWMPGADGPSSAEKLVRELSGTKVIFLSWFYSDQLWFDAPGDIERVLAAGAVGFLPKHCSVATVADAVRTAERGEWPVLAESLEHLIAVMRRHREQLGETWERLTKLSRREIEILQLLGDGVPPKLAAETLFISLTTLRTHVQRILRKTETHSVTEASAIARNFGVIRS